MAMVGQYQGPEGTAALAVVAPVWNILYSLGLLTGIGGSVLMSTAKGGGEERRKNEYFTAALAGTVLLAAASWLVIGLFDTLCCACSAQNGTCFCWQSNTCCRSSLRCRCFVQPNAGGVFEERRRPGPLATAAVLAGGAFNVAGDYVFVFALKLGIFGAGWPRAIGALITFAVMLAHFFRPQNTLRLAAARAAGGKTAPDRDDGVFNLFLSTRPWAF